MVFLFLGVALAFCKCSSDFRFCLLYVLLRRGDELYGRLCTTTFLINLFFSDMVVNTVKFGMVRNLALRHFSEEYIPVSVVLYYTF